MALTRKFLKALEIDDEKIDQIIEAHTDVTDSLKRERDGYKEEAAKLSEIQKELEDVTKERDALQKKSDEDDSYKAKYEDERKAFDEFKKGVEADKTKARKTEAFTALLKKAGVKDSDNGSRYKGIIRATALDEMELDDKGELKNADKVVESIKAEWSDFIVTTSTKGADTETPPANTGGKMTKEEIMKIKDRNERQQAIAENHELFGF